MSAKTSPTSESRKKVSQARKKLKTMTLEERLELMVHANAMTAAQAMTIREQAAKKSSPPPAKVVSVPKTIVPVSGKIVVVRSKHVSATKKQAIAKGGKKK